MSDESRLEEQMLNEALQEDAAKRGAQKKTEPVSLPQAEENKQVDVPLPTTVEPVQVAQPDQRETPQQENFRYLREERERLEKKLEQERRERRTY